jgi:hypothetical protein
VNGINSVLRKALSRTVFIPFRAWVNGMNSVLRKALRRTEFIPFLFPQFVELITLRQSAAGLFREACVE